MPDWCGITVVANVMHIHAQPVSRAVHIKLPILTTSDDIVYRADFVFIEQFGIEHALCQYAQCSVVTIGKSRAGTSRVNGGVLRFEHDFVECFLGGTEFAVHREGTRDV